MGPMLIGELGVARQVVTSVLLLPSDTQKATKNVKVKMARAALLCAAFAAVAHGACPMDPNGVAGASCREVCECGSKPCSADVEGPDYSRCINHDGFFDRLDEDDHDCADAIRCCVPLEECAPACSIPIQSQLLLVFDALTNYSSKECVNLFSNQVHGNAQDDHELCECIQQGLAQVEADESIAKWTMLNEAITTADCRMQAGESLTLHEITQLCMSTSVVGDPFLVVGEEKIKFFLPPGEMVELLSWASPSGKPVSLRGSTFQQKGSKRGAWHKNVQWFRRFELKLANETALEITSLHKNEPPLSYLSFATELLALQPEAEAARSAELRAFPLQPEVEAARLAEVHAKRKSYVEVKLDGKEVAVRGPKAMPVTLYSELAKEIGLKITAVQTKEHKIGGELAERVDVSTDKLKFRLWSSKAGKFTNPAMQVKYAHLNFDMLGPFPPHVRGFFAELRGKVPMSERSKTYLRKVDLEPVL